MSRLVFNIAQGASLALVAGGASYVWGPAIGAIVAGVWLTVLTIVAAVFA